MVEKIDVDLVPGSQRSSLMRIAACVLVIVCTGCGSSAPDGGGSASSTGSVTVDRGASSTALPNKGVTMPTSAVEKGEGKTAVTKQAEDHRAAADSSVPQTITNDLTSPDPRVRYDALGHWEAKDHKSSLDPVFEAMEDEDPAVRGRATAIIEQYWAAEQEKEQG